MAEKSVPIKTLIRYFNYWATEFSYLLLLVTSILALVILATSNQPVSTDNKYLVYSLIFVGFVFLLISQYRRKAFEKTL